MAKDCCAWPDELPYTYTGRVIVNEAGQIYTTIKTVNVLMNMHEICFNFHGK